MTTRSGGGTDIYAYQALDGSGKEIAFKIVSTMYPSDIVHEEQDGDKVEGAFVEPVS